jgi:hypothetical protein
MTESNSTTTRRSGGFLTPTFTSVATAGVSAYLAVTSVAAAPLTDMGDKIVLGGAVAVGTFLAAKLGRSAGALLGLLGGGTVGAATGAGLGALASRGGQKAEGAAKGGAVGGAGLGISLAIAGAMTGYWGGAYLGHHLSKDIALDYLTQKNQNHDAQQAQTPTATAPVQVIKLQP